MNIQTIIDKLDDIEIDASDIAHHTTYNGCIKIEDAKQFLKDSLTSMLDGIEKETLDKMEQLMVYAKDNREDYETVNEAHFATAQLKEVINIINSHR